MINISSLIVKEELPRWGFRLCVYLTVLSSFPCSLSCYDELLHLAYICIFCNVDALLSVPDPKKRGCKNVIVKCEEFAFIVPTGMHVQDVLGTHIC
jgi:hypothetical protein